MNMLYVFLLLSASQFLLASSFEIRREKNEKEMKTLLVEIIKTAPKSINSKAHPLLAMKGQKTPRGASLLGHNQAKCKRHNFVLLIVFLGIKGRIFERKVEKTSLVLAHNIK